MALRQSDPRAQFFKHQADPGLNLDATISRAASLSSFVALSAYESDSGVVSDQRYQQVMLANLAALYWVVGFQVLRQVLLLYQTLPATSAPQPLPRLEQARTTGRLDWSHPAAPQPDNLIRSLSHQADVLAAGVQPPSIFFTGPSGQCTPIELPAMQHCGTSASADVTQARVTRARRARGATAGSTTMGRTDVLAAGVQPPSISFIGPSGQCTPIELPAMQHSGTSTSADVTQARVTHARRGRYATAGSTTMGRTADLNSMQGQQLEWLEDLCDEDTDSDEYEGEFGV